MTNAAPSIGQCSVSPTDGIVLQTQFTVTCTGFTDPDTPLTYKIHTTVGQSDTGLKKYFIYFLSFFKFAKYFNFITLFS